MHLNINKLLAEYEKGKDIKNVEILELPEEYKNNKRMTAYNPALLKEYLLARIEPIDDEFASKVMFCREENGKLYPMEDMPVLNNSQDPFTTELDGELIIGCVEITDNKKSKTVFYDRNLEKIAEGPVGMKCLRIFDLNDKIGVFTRPWGGVFGKGKIGYTTVNSLEELEKKNLWESEIIDMFPENYWGGVNAVYPFDDEIFALGHIATSYRVDGINHKTYYAVSFKFDPERREVRDFKIILDRKDLPETIVKREELKNIVYPGGLRGIEKDYVTLYAGISDAVVGKITMKNPLITFR